MRVLGTSLVLCVVLGTAACGPGGSGGSGAATGASSSSGSSGSSGATSGSTACARPSTVVARADLDHDGSPQDVRLCGTALVATIGSRAARVDVRRLRLTVDKARVVHLQGAGDLVLVPSRHTTDGRFQPHLFGASRGGLGEVLFHGRPLLPRVSTAPGSPPLTAVCAPGGRVAVVSAEAHQPPGFVLAWDVTRTTYDVRDGVAVRSAVSVVENAAADPTLRREMPHLFDGSLFAGCGSAT